MFATVESSFADVFTLMTSISDNLYWIECSGPGQLAIAARPRGGDWLEDEIENWRRTGVKIVVSLLTREEVVELDLDGEAQACERKGVRLINVPVEDRCVPDSQAETRSLVRRLREELACGRNVVVHCRQGIGRSSLLAACLLVAEGIEPNLAWDKIGSARGANVPDTSEQRQWVAAFAE